MSPAQTTPRIDVYPSVHRYAPDPDPNPTRYDPAQGALTPREPNRAIGTLPNVANNNTRDVLAVPVDYSPKSTHDRPQFRDTRTG